MAPSASPTPQPVAGVTAAAQSTAEPVALADAQAIAEPAATQSDDAVPAAAPATEAQIVNIVWQWSDLVETLPAAQAVVPDPQNYTITFLEDGTLGIKADCNRAAGTYTADGGMVGGVRVQMGPTTLAECGPDSRTQELIQSLMAAQDYRVEPGGAELQPNMPAGGPVLHFQRSGPALVQ
jgi:heat shock protein HslJ